jgi:hypothetical protein
MERPRRIERRGGDVVLAVDAIESECSTSNCGRSAVAVAAFRRPGEAYWLWFCELHFRELRDEILAAPGPPPPGMFASTDVVRVCGFGVEDSPCGALASRVSLLEDRVDDRPILGIAFLCDRHAAEMEGR